MSLIQKFQRESTKFKVNSGQVKSMVLYVTTLTRALPFHRVAEETMGVQAVL